MGRLALLMKTRPAAAPNNRAEFSIAQRGVTERALGSDGLGGRSAVVCAELDMIFNRQRDDCGWSLIGRRICRSTGASYETAPFPIAIGESRVPYRAPLSRSVPLAGGEGAT